MIHNVFFLNHLFICFYCFYSFGCMFLQIWSVHCGYFTYIHLFSWHIHISCHHMSYIHISLETFSCSSVSRMEQLLPRWWRCRDMRCISSQKKKRAEVARRDAWLETCFEMMTAIGVHLGSTSACVAVFKVRFPSFCWWAVTIKNVAHYCL